MTAHLSILRATGEQLSRRIGHGRISARVVLNDGREVVVVRVSIDNGSAQRSAIACAEIAAALTSAGILHNVRAY